MNRTGHILCLLLMLTLSCGRLMAQVDNDFWFAVPYLTDAHDQSQTYGYGKICLTSFGDTAHVTITQPGVTNPSDIHYLAPMQLTLPPQTSVDIPVGQGSINRAAQSGQSPYGIHIASDHSITAYYAQINNNSEMYTLKGRNALGTSFLVGMQRSLGNAHSACASIDVLATEDNTHVTIVTLVDTYTGRRNHTLTVTLQKGEIYSVRAMSSSAADHLGGSVVTSDKPVCVNSNDDSLASTGQDLAGDQLVPESLAGNEYISVRHTASQEQLILYTFPNRPIQYQVDGGTQQTLAGGSYTILSPTTATTYLSADDDFVCFQLSGNGGELGGTILPRLDCTGSHEVVFKKRFDTEVVTLLIKTAYTGSFTANGIPLTATFLPVPYATGWSYCNLTNVPFDANGIVRISNSQAIFHAAILDYGGGGTCSYGYFSGYNSLSLVARSDKTTYQQGETIHLSIEDSTLFANVVWTFPDGSTHSGASVTNTATDSTDAGVYSVTATSLDGCTVLLDENSVDIAVDIPNPDPQPDPDPEPEPDPQPDPDPQPEPEPEPILVVDLLTEHVEVCDGDSLITLDYQVREGRAHRAQVEVGSKTYTFMTDSLQTALEVPLEGLIPDRYIVYVSFADTIHGLQTDALSCGLTLYYDPEGIFAQKWDNVLAIFAPDYSSYGFAFDGAFQWYRNGQPIPDATASIYRIADGELDTGDYYQVETTRTSDGVTLLTCPYYPHTPVYESPAPQMIYNQLGQRVSEAKQPGFYIVTDGVETVKMIVR